MVSVEVKDWSNFKRGLSPESLAIVEEVEKMSKDERDELWNKYQGGVKDFRMNWR